MQRFFAKRSGSSMNSGPRRSNKSSGRGSSGTGGRLTGSELRVPGARASPSNSDPLTIRPFEPTRGHVGRHPLGASVVDVTPLLKKSFPAACSRIDKTLPHVAFRHETTTGRLVQQRAWQKHEELPCSRKTHMMSTCTSRVSFIQCKTHH